MAKGNRVHVEEAGGEMGIEAINPETGESVDTSILEDAGIAFDPAKAPLDLTKDEKRRTTALVLAIQAYDKLIIKDAEYLREAHAQARSDGSVIRPATMDAMVMAAIQFDGFISGRLGVQRSRISRESQAEIPPSGESGEADPAVVASAGTISD